MANKVKKPKFPTRALIGPVAWQIEERDLRDRKVYGSCSSIAKHYIHVDTINPRQDVEIELIDTLLHELLHAMDDTWRIGLSEKQVSLLAEALEHFLPRNPHITYWVEKYHDWLEEQ